MDFYKKAHLLFKKRHVSDCQEKIYFVQTVHLKFKSYYSNQPIASTFFF